MLVSCSLLDMCLVLLHWAILAMNVVVAFLLPTSSQPNKRALFVVFFPVSLLALNNK